jgi:hypothetical protein
MYEGNPGISPITRATPEELALMAARLPNGRKWPFSTMNVGDQVVITKDIRQAQSAMRTYAARNFASFASRRDPETGALIVIRTGPHLTVR